MYEGLIKLSEPVIKVKLGRKVPRLPYTGLQFDSLRITMDSDEWDIRVLLQKVIAPSFKEALDRELKSLISDAIDLLCKCTSFYNNDFLVSPYCELVEDTLYLYGR